MQKYMSLLKDVNSNAGSNRAAAGYRIQLLLLKKRPIFNIYISERDLPWLEIVV